MPKEGIRSGGTSTAPAVSEEEDYNNRLQHSVISATNSTATIFSLSYGYGPVTSNNGNVMAITNNLDNTRNQTFTYDSLNRVATGQSAATSGTACWGQLYGYDAWGNLLSTAGLSTKAGCSFPQFTASAGVNNQLTGFGYDAAGNLTQEGLGTPSWKYTYNAENELTGISGSATGTFIYDGDGQRVKFAGKGLFWRQPNGPFLSKSDPTGSIIVERMYFNGLHVGAWHPGGAVSFFAQDALGGEHIVTDGSGNVCEDDDTLPFGTDIAYINNCDQSYKFAGMERDDQTSANLDYDIARYYNSRIGRWLIPDWDGKPATVPYANFGNPQSLNLYSYVKNNPTTLGDPDGHCGAPSAFKPDKRESALPRTSQQRCSSSMDYRGVVMVEVQAAMEARPGSKPGSWSIRRKAVLPKQMKRSTTAESFSKTWVPKE